jgi:hypothetical protein
MVLKWSHIIKGSFIIAVLIYGLYLAYRNSQMKSESTFQNIITIPGNPYNIPYSIPGSIANPNMIFGPNYLPLESNVPSIDILRSQKQIQIPAYHKQLIQQAY